VIKPRRSQPFRQCAADGYTSSCIRCSSWSASSTRRSLRGAADVGIRGSTPLRQQDPTIQPAQAGHYSDGAHIRPS
jgi:hypothetical protein